MTRGRNGEIPPGNRAPWNNRLFRPDQIYTGTHGAPYIPMEARQYVDQDAIARGD